jgi:general L-amino acid transport system permease protein
VSLRNTIHGLAFLLLGWLTWQLLSWGVIDAVFRPDAQACQALEREAACWGVVVEKFRWLLLGSPQQWGGLPLTLLLFVGSWSLSWPLGVALALARRSTRAWLAWPAAAFIETVRGVPLVGLLFAAAFLMPLFWPNGDAPDLVWRAGLALTLFSSAYLAEIIRGGLQTVPPEQVEAATTLGLGWWGTQRRVVLPQALRTVLPALTGHAIGLLKDTSLVMVIGLHEMTGGLSLSLGGDSDWRPFYFEAYLFVGAIYALLCLVLSRLGLHLEARWQRSQA